LTEKTDMTVAKTILQQLGGRRFTAMTGASSFSGGERMLSFRLPARITKHRAWGMMVTLQADDLYTLELLRMKDFEVEKVDVRTDVFVENLRETFTDMTGLDTSLGRSAA
jgi:hypothetical protein